MNKIFTPTVAYITILVICLLNLFTTLFLIGTFTSYLNDQTEIIRNATAKISATPSATLAPVTNTPTPTTKKLFPTATPEVSR